MSIKGIFLCFLRAIEVFQSVLSLSPSFARASEVHLRLGVMFKKRGEYEKSLKHYKSALTAAGPSSLTKLESKCDQTAVLWCWSHTQ